MRKKSEQPPRLRQGLLFDEAKPPARNPAPVVRGTPAFHEPVSGKDPNEPKGVMAENRYMACVGCAPAFQSQYPVKPIRKGTAETFRYLGRCSICRTLMFGEMPTFDPRPVSTLF